MFALRTRPLEIEASRIRGLRLSLNAPVVRLPELPSGAARAAIVVHETEGRARLAVAVRSAVGPEMAVYEPEETEELADGDALDAALGFAESMGFLFDDEEVDPGDAASQERAVERWRSFRSGGPGSDRAAPDGDPVELELEEALSEMLPEGPSAAEAAGPGPLALTKFRAAAPPAPGAPDPPRRRRKRAARRPVGLIRLVQRVARRTEAPPSGLLQLLGQF